MTVSPTLSGWSEKPEWIVTRCLEPGTTAGSEMHDEGADDLERWHDHAATGLGRGHEAVDPEARALKDQRAIADYTFTPGDSGAHTISRWREPGHLFYAQTSGRIRQDGLLAPGLPGYTPNPFEQVRDANGVLWIHYGSGVWRPVNTVRVDAAVGTGVPFTPTRLVDTRTSAKPAKNSILKYAVAGTGSLTSKIPTDAIAVMGNLTATGYSGAGFLTISPAGVTVTTSSVNFITGQKAIVNSFIVGLGTGTDLGKLQVHVSNNTASHYIIDITAYIQ